MEHGIKRKLSAPNRADCDDGSRFKFLAAVVVYFFFYIIYMRLNLLSFHHRFTIFFFTNFFFRASIIINSCTQWALDLKIERKKPFTPMGVVERHFFFYHAFSFFSRSFIGAISKTKFDTSLLYRNGSEGNSDFSVYSFFTTFSLFLSLSVFFYLVYKRFYTRLFFFLSLFPSL